MYYSVFTQKLPGMLSNKTKWLKNKTNNNNNKNTNKSTSYQPVEVIRLLYKGLKITMIYTYRKRGNNT
jgi:hypothetical protein